MDWIYDALKRWPYVLCVFAGLAVGWWVTDYVLRGQIDVKQAQIDRLESELASRPSAGQVSTVQSRKLEIKDWTVQISTETSLVGGDQPWLRALANLQSDQAANAGYVAERFRVLVAETKEIGYETKPFGLVIKPLQHKIDSCFVFRKDPVDESHSYTYYAAKRADMSWKVDHMALKSDSRLVVLILHVKTDETKDIPFLKNGQDIKLEFNQ